MLLLLHLFPENGKIAMVACIFKSKTASGRGNYQHFAKSSLLLRLFQKLVYDLSNRLLEGKTLI